MKLLRKRDIPEERYTNAFLGYGPEDSHFVVELTYSKWSLYVNLFNALIQVYIKYSLRSFYRYGLCKSTCCI